MSFSASEYLNKVIQILYIEHEIFDPLTFVSLINYGSNVSNDVVIELYKVDGPQLDVGVVQILGVLVENHQLLLWQVDNHHSLVEILHGKTELQQVDASILLKILQKRRQKICVF